ncbi:MAG: hypothetical protein M0013_12500 [Actinomycetota bacterium]|nr:hypothetical protein [Actinomycetota bacterium]
MAAPLLLSQIQFAPGLGWAEGTPATEIIPLPAGVSEISAWRALRAGLPSWALVQTGHWSPIEKLRVTLVQWMPPSVVVSIVVATVC